MLEGMKRIRGRPDEVIPLYKPRGAYGVERVHLELDLEHRTTRIVFGDLKNLHRVWRGLVWYIPIAPTVLGDPFEALMASDEIQNLIERVFAGAELYYDPDGHLRGRGDYDALRAQKEIRGLLKKLPKAAVWRPWEWLRLFYGYKKIGGVHYLQGRAITSADLEALSKDVHEVYSDKEGEVHVIPGLHEYIEGLALENTGGRPQVPLGGG